MFTTLDAPVVIDPKAIILVENRDFPPVIYGWGSRRNIAITFGTENYRMVWLHDGEKTEDTIHEREERQTDARTHRHLTTA